MRPQDSSKLATVRSKGSQGVQGVQSSDNSRGSSRVLGSFQGWKLVGDRILWNPACEQLVRTL